MLFLVDFDAKLVVSCLFPPPLESYAKKLQFPV